MSALWQASLAFEKSPIWNHAIAICATGVVRPLAEVGPEVLNGVVVLARLVGHLTQVELRDAGVVRVLTGAE